MKNEQQLKPNLRHVASMVGQASTLVADGLYEAYETLDGIAVANFCERVV